jgi:hypothetical protein
MTMEAFAEWWPRPLGLSLFQLQSHIGVDSQFQLQQRKLG